MGQLEKLLYIYIKKGTSTHLNQKYCFSTISSLKQMEKIIKINLWFNDNVLFREINLILQYNTLYQLNMTYLGMFPIGSSADIPYSDIVQYKYVPIIYQNCPLKT